MTALICAMMADRSRVCDAAFTFLGPIPYLSQADSPFLVASSSADFYLENFEDGALNTTGVFQPLLPITHGLVLDAEAMTDSVDIDDGAIDGKGTGGHSLASNQYMVFPTDPPRSWSLLRFGFNPAELGYLPTAIGFVWTDGVSPNEVLIELFDENWQLLGQHQFVGLGDAKRTGESEEDRFLGVVSDIPVTYLQITSKYEGEPSFFEIDHLQYGLANVPEPSMLAMAVVCFLGILVQRRKPSNIVRKGFASRESKSKM